MCMSQYERHIFWTVVTERFSSFYMRPLTIFAWERNRKPRTFMPIIQRWAWTTETFTSGWDPAGPQGLCPIATKIKPCTFRISERIEDPGSNPVRDRLIAWWASKTGRAVRILVWKPHRALSLGRLKTKLEDNIKIDRWEMNVSGSATCPAVDC
jgi:hypothetical protein